MTVGELERRMSTREFAEWVAFYVVEAKEAEAAYRRAEQKAKARLGRRR
jgi:hypothetical protein